jgi:hypothetical protein
LAGSPGKPTGSNPGRAPRTDPTHDVCIHRRGWRLVLHPDGTTTAYGPDGQILHSHSPPTTRAG